MKKNKKKHQQLSDSLSVVTLFPGENSRGAIEAMQNLPIDLFVGVPTGYAKTFDGLVDSLWLQQLDNQTWHFIDYSVLKKDWVLFLEADEYLDEKSLTLLTEMLPKVTRTLHMLSITRFLPTDEIKQFDWVTTRKTFSAPTANMSTYHSLELRLLPTALLEGVLIKESHGNELSPRFYLNLSQAHDHTGKSNFLPLTVSRSEPPRSDNPFDPPADREIFINGHGKFFADKELLEEFEWPRTMYFLIRKDHVLTILQGLQEGTAPRSIVMFTVNYLMRMGEFELAQQFLASLPKHWEIRDDLVISQMKIIIYLAGKDFSSARQVLERCKTKAENDPLFLENLGKFYLLLNERKEAAEFFQKSLDKLGESDEKSHLKSFLGILKEHPDRRPTLTACIICRDEEECLPKALKSVLGLADEIIVVDTGSSDRSREIANQYGARVFDLPWNMDFSEARNLAFQKATSDYVLMLDADESLYSANFVDFQVMKRLLPLQKPSAFVLSVGHLKIETDWMNVLNSSGNFIREVESPRIIPKIPELRYEGRVDESISESLAKLNTPILILPERQVRIHHDVLAREKRIARKLSVYEKLSDPGVNEILAAIRDFSFLNEKAETLKWLKRLIEKVCEEKLSSFSKMGISLALLTEEGSLDEAKNALEKMAEAFPEDLEIRIALSSFLIRHGYISELSKLNFSQQSVLDRPQNSREMEYWIYSGLASLERGDVDSAAWVLDRVLALKPDYLFGQAARFYLLSRIGDVASSSLALEDIFAIVRGQPGLRINTWVAFFNTVEQLSGILEKWNHPVERSLLLHGALSLKETGN